MKLTRLAGGGIRCSAAGSAFHGNRARSNIWVCRLGWGSSPGRCTGDRRIDSAPIGNHGPWNLQSVSIGSLIKCPNRKQSKRLPYGHAHWYVPLWSTQIPPFRHGWLEHSSIAVWHKSPIHPTTGRQLFPLCAPNNKILVRRTKAPSIPFWNGRLWFWNIQSPARHSQMKSSPIPSMHLPPLRQCEPADVPLQTDTSCSQS